MKQINQVSDIDEFAGKVVMVEFEWNPYKSGIGKVWGQPEWFSNRAYGYHITMAIKDGVDSRLSITDNDIEKGTVKIRLATAEEIANAILSYDEVWI